MEILQARLLIGRSLYRKLRTKKGSHEKRIGNKEMEDRKLIEKPIG